MRVVVDVFREPDGRLEGRVELPNGQRDVFASTLDLLRVLEGLDLARLHPTLGQPLAPEAPPRRESEENRD